MTEEKEETALEVKKAEEKIAQKIEGSKGGSEWVEIDYSKRYEEMSIEELQAVIYEKMRKNGPVTERMKQDIIENVYHNTQQPRLYNKHLFLDVPRMEFPYVEVLYIMHSDIHFL